ncbi:hypothetical protein HID58_096123 [Brassica napus]|uniref:Uncharacterized protein n=1 Tax=Brassica napus TaxID=3708 RepID=A0ABQ7X1D3_BRANA|nr:hypothetical protein HID58_096123 [Brassica napus]
MRLFALVDLSLLNTQKPIYNQFRLGIHKEETIQFIKIHMSIVSIQSLHFSTNLISFVILSGYSFWGKEKAFILILGFFDSLLTDLCIGFHSPHGWELMIGYIYKDFGLLIMSKFIWSSFYLSRKRLLAPSVSLMIYIKTWHPFQVHLQFLPSRIRKIHERQLALLLCANCHLASKPVAIEVHKRHPKVGGFGQGDAEIDFKIHYVSQGLFVLLRICGFGTKSFWFLKRNSLKAIIRK